MELKLCGQAIRNQNTPLSMLPFQTFVGGIFDTNAYLVTAANGIILFDAPTGIVDWLESIKATPTALLITHGHVDHIDGAAKVKQRFNCQVGYHPDTVPFATDRSFFKQFGFSLEIEPIPADFLVTETDLWPAWGEEFQVLLVPGHCPGSLCFYLPKHDLLIGGDVLFAGGVGRWDLPGGSQRELLSNIRRKILPLPDQTLVLPGHGPSTTIGEERESNPYLEF